MRSRSVVFVCTANQCRSPMAEYLLKRRLAPDSKWDVLSAGTAATRGFPASRQALVVMDELGTDISAHRSQPVTSELVDSASLLITMTASQRDEILERFPRAKGKVFVLKSLGTGGRSEDVQDPVGMGADDYRRIRDEIDDVMADVVIFMFERGGL